MNHAEISHEEIDSRDVVDRYVLGRLESSEQERFEDHFAECARCLEAVELAQELRAGLEEVGADALRSGGERETASRPADVVAFERPADAGATTRTVTSTPVSATTRRRALQWAAVIVLALLPSFWLAERNADLRGRLAEIERPVLVTPHARLELHRRSTGGAADRRAVRVTPAPGDRWIHLAVDVGDLDVDSSTGGSDVRVAVTLANADGETVWSDDALPAPPHGALTLSLPRRLVPPGAYRLDISLRAGERREPAGSFAFEVADAEIDAP